MQSRSVSNHAPALEAAYASLAERVRGEFRRQPALVLTAGQAAEWLDLDPELSARVLHALAAEGLLEYGPDSTYRLLLQH